MEILKFCSNCGAKRIEGASFCGQCGQALNAETGFDEPENPTPFPMRCEILADVYLNHRDEEELEDFVVYNDLGLPLAYLIANDLVEPSEKAIEMVDETWDLLLGLYGLSRDSGFEDLDGLASQS